MIREVNMQKLLDEGNVVARTVVGTSMYPLLRNRKDIVVISKKEERLKKYDIPLYKRGNSYVLHRIIEVKPEYYLIRGDNCVQREYVKDEQILGVVTGIFRGEKEIRMNSMSYKIYVLIWTALFPIRCVYKKIKSKVARMIKHQR